ncbi:MAG: periplasmic heavy metal sensor [Candidatus Omnitrophica bacterium]|nr:periplasmic heavy metal sensor [Candidatus Omnitrophota bacterium]
MKKWCVGFLVFLLVAGAGYLASLGCCRLLGWHKKPVSLMNGLGLSASQKKALAEAEKEFLRLKAESCGVLCAKRAQLIQLLKEPAPDRRTMDLVVEAIGRQQTALEKGTLQHLLAAREHLTPAQWNKLVDSVSDQLRQACRQTACGDSPGCALKNNGGQ